MSRYIKDTDVYKLVEPSGTARVHCSQIDELPRADVVEVVRCKNCRFWEEYCVKDADEIALLEKEFGFEIRVTSACIGECHCKEWLGANNYVSRQRGLNDYCSYGERRGK